MDRKIWLLAIIAAGVALTWWGVQDTGSTVQNDIDTTISGSRLVDGSEPLQAHMSGHDEALPPAAAICFNCHKSNNSGSKSGSASFAPILTKDYLLVARARRGGPPTIYQLSAFCRVLREGIDPAEIMVDTVMPRYTVSQEQCTQMWQFLITQNANG